MNGLSYRAAVRPNPSLNGDVPRAEDARRAACRRLDRVRFKRHKNRRIAVTNDSHLESATLDFSPSAPWRRSTFRILLPRVDEAPAAQRPTRAAPAPTGKETLLLVEDDARVLRLAQRILERLGYRVLPCGHPRDALVIARNHSGEIALLVTDVVLPKMNGRALAAEITAARPAIKVLYTSGYTDDVIAAGGSIEAGVHFLSKPYTTRSLRELIVKWSGQPCS